MGFGIGGHYLSALQGNLDGDRMECLPEKLIGM